MPPTRPTDAAVPWTVQSVLREPTERTLVLRGPVVTEIRYTTVGLGESVYVDGELAAKTSGLTLDWKLVTVAPRVRFDLHDGRDWLPARVDVSIYFAFWKGIKDFRLTIADAVIYEERGGRILVPEIPDVPPAR